jgi:hypothetical protein
MSRGATKTPAFLAVFRSFLRFCSGFVYLPEIIGFNPSSGSSENKSGSMLWLRFVLGATFNVFNNLPGSFRRITLLKLDLSAVTAVEMLPNIFMGAGEPSLILVLLGNFNVLPRAQVCFVVLMISGT